MQLVEDIYADVDDLEIGQLFSKSIEVFFKSALRIVLKDPTMTYFLLRTIRRQRKAARIRLDWEKKGIHVPPLMIFSVTKQCNLQCKGCYARAQLRPSESDMTDEKLSSIFEEARGLGISLIIVAGGEPLVRKGLLSITMNFPEIIFPIFTNGMLIDAEMIEKLKKQSNVVPVISLEGYEEDTDERRGKVYDHLLKAIKTMDGQGILFGTSLTLTRKNFSTVTDETFVRGLIASGCKLFFFVEYVPIQFGTEDLALTDEQRLREPEIVRSFRSKLPALFVAFPGDEGDLGGCLAAGRGFVHISPGGHLEPCPFSPFSDANLMEVSLKKALKSRFLRTIRNNRERLAESKGGCALWENRKWVSSLLQQKPGEQSKNI
jgi:MoaA/NifB/PqqE/SkfB family radical SAM enzyme